jgi:hypothetical protein
LQKITYHCSHQIWKIEVLDLKHIVVELRDIEFFKTYWKVFSLENEHCSYSFENIKNSWWKSIVAAKSDKIVLHELKQGKNPEISGTEIIDLSKNSVEFYPLHQFEYIRNEQITLSRNSQNNINIPCRHSELKIINPDTYSESNGFFVDFKTLIQSKFEDIACLECEYLEYNDYIIIAHYIRLAENNYTSKISILNTAGDIIFSEVTNTNLKGSTYGMFFVFQHKLIFTSDQNQINIITI